MRYVLFLFIFFPYLPSLGQVIINPVFDRTDTPEFHVDRVEIKKDSTLLFCSYTAESESWANISSDTYIEDVITKRKLKIIRSEGLPFNPCKRFFSVREEVAVILYFKSIGKSRLFNLVENPSERAFNIYGINLDTLPYSQVYSDYEILRDIRQQDFYYQSGNIEKSINYCKSVLDGKKFLFGVKSPEVGKTLYELASLYYQISCYSEAIHYGKEGVTIDLANNLADEDIVLDYNNLSHSYYAIGDFRSAIDMAAKSKSLLAKTDTINEDYATVLTNLSKFCNSLGNYNEALLYARQSLLIKERTVGENSESYAISLSNYAMAVSNLGNYEEAIRLETEAMEIRKKVLGIEHPDYATSLNNLALYNSSIGNYFESIRLGTESMDIYQKVHGTEHPDYASLLANLALYNAHIGSYSEAIRFGTKAMEIQKRVLGTEHPYYATLLSNLATYNSDIGNYSEAIRLETEAMEIRKKVIGAENPVYAASLGNLATYNAHIGSYSEAIRLGTKAMEIHKKSLVTEHPDYANSLSNLASCYSYIGNYSEAIRLGTEAKEIFQKAFGTEHSVYAASLGNLATYNAHIGNYSEAIRLETEAMEIRKKVLGIEHPDYANSLSNLATCNSSIGNYSEAIRLGTEAMEIRKKAFGTEHPDYANSLSNLASCYSDIGNYSEAIRLETEAMEIRKKVIGAEHPFYAASLGNLATYNAHIGSHSEAIRLGTEAMTIRKKVLGTEHPDYALSLGNLATCNSSIGNYSEAIRLETEAMEIRKKVLGTEHPDYALSLGNLASYYYLICSYENAYNYLSQQKESSRKYILKNIGELSSNYQKSLWTTKFAYAFLETFPYVVSQHINKESISELYNNTCLFAKGILLNTGLEMRKLILESKDSTLINKYKTLSTNIHIYNKLIDKPIKERYLNTDSLNVVIHKQEMELARESKVYGDYTRNLTITWKDIQRNLEEGDMAIEFLDYPIIGTNNTMYVALTLKKEYDSPHLVTLFDGNQLKAIPEDVYYTQTYVSDLVWKPLEEELEDIRNIYFAPSGELHRIGIEYLPISKTKNISEVYSLHRLSSTRQLAFIQDETKGKNAILYGGINYDEKSNTFSTDSSSVEGNALRHAFCRANVDSLSLRSSVEYLEGTKREADMIAEKMKKHSVPYIYYCGTDGTEESFKHLDGTKPQKLHIATHGFYLTEVEADKSKYVSPKLEWMTEGNNGIGRSIEDKSMTRSGLLLSGCNRAFRHEQISKDEEDGILTAQEISMLDLRGLDLVVLSACQTGLGEIISGEGVFGLQRGFKKAGANTILMSLDKVDDEATRILMVEFYRNLMNGKTKRESLKEAQLYLRKVDNGKYDDPKYWASFIMLDGIN